MPKFQVQVTVIGHHLITVEADNKSDAVEEVLNGNFDSDLDVDRINEDYNTDIEETDVTEVKE